MPEQPRSGRPKATWPSELSTALRQWFSSLFRSLSQTWWNVRETPLAAGANILTVDDTVVFTAVGPTHDGFNLPPADTVPGKLFFFKEINDEGATNSTLIIRPHGSDTIDGRADSLALRQGGSTEATHGNFGHKVLLISDGKSGWWTVAGTYFGQGGLLIAADPQRPNPGSPPEEDPARLRFGRTENGPFITCVYDGADVDDQGLRIYYHPSSANADPDVLAMQLSGGTGSNETPLLIRNNPGGGGQVVTRVTLGAVDSGGSGFRVLRVPN